jgi:hypothetical protein
VSDDESKRRLSAIAVRLALLAERDDAPQDLRAELRMTAVASQVGVSQLADGRIAFSTGALAEALGLCSRGHLLKWRRAGVGPRAIALPHGEKTTWVYPAAGVRDWLSECALAGGRPTTKMMQALADLGYVQPDPAEQLEAA